MTTIPEGRAVVYCEGAFASTYGKTAHGLVRRSRRYELSCVVDSTLAGRDAGELLDGKPAQIPIVANLAAGLALRTATHFVIGLAPDGGRLDAPTRRAIVEAIDAGLHVDCGLHDFLTEDAELVELARGKGVTLRDVRRPPDRRSLHFFTGKIREVESVRIALLGTDSAVGKRTTAWMLVDRLNAEGTTAELIGTGQTSWLQGARYGVVLDSLVNDFVSGEIEHAILRCWDAEQPQVMLLEGQGSLLNPAYPGGFELIAAGRPHAIILQHAPARTSYDGFPSHRLHPLDHQIQAVELISGRPVVAIAVNHEGLVGEQIDETCRSIEREVDLPTVAPLRHGVDRLVEVVRPMIGRATA